MKKQKITGEIVGWDNVRKLACIYCASRQEHFFVDFTFAHFVPSVGGFIEFDIVSNHD